MTRNIMLKIFFIITFSIGGFNVYSVSADTLSGTVLDAETGAPVQAAAVQIVELSTGLMTGTDGGFSLPGIPQGEYTIRISRPGYAAIVRTFTIPASSPLIIRLTVSPIGEGDIVVTARGRGMSTDDIPGSVEVVTDEAFREANPVSLPDMLARRPGIAVSSEMPWSERAVIRGLTRDQVVLLVDGARVVTATATAAQFGAIAHGDIERVEVLKGPISVLYGSGSTGGVVNVITRKGGFSSDPRWNVIVNPSYESAANGLTSYERAGWSNSRLYLGISQSNRRYTDYRASDGLRIPNSQFEDRQTQLTAGVKIANNHLLEVRHQRFEALDAGLPGASSFPENALASYPLTTRTLTDAAWTWRSGAVLVAGISPECLLSACGTPGAVAAAYRANHGRQARFHEDNASQCGCVLPGSGSPRLRGALAE